MRWCIYALGVASSLVSGAYAADGAGATTVSKPVQPDVCISGTMQSPIDLHSCSVHHEVKHEHYNMPTERPKMKPAYAADRADLEKVCTGELERSGCYLKLTPGSDLGVTLTNKLDVPGIGTYDLEHCIVRIPAEHTVNGMHYAMEVQCEHIMDGTDERRKAIVSTLYENGVTIGTDDNPSRETFSGFVSLFDKKLNSSSQVVVKPFSFGSTTGTAGLTRYYTYKGSRTTGTCSEDVDWFVMYDPTGISKDQLQLLKDTFTQGWLPARTTQKLYGRHPDACHHAKVAEDAASPTALGAMSLALALLSLFARQ